MPTNPITVHVIDDNPFQTLLEIQINNLYLKGIATQSAECLATEMGKVLEHLILQALKEANYTPEKLFSGIQQSVSKDDPEILKMFSEGSPISTKPKVDSYTILGPLAKAIPALDEYNVLCPECATYSYLPGIDPFQRVQKLSTIIIHLNDAHHWPRERIADWLDTLPVDLTFKEIENAEQPSGEVF